jgi:hypothetical protein
MRMAFCLSLAWFSIGAALGSPDNIEIKGVILDSETGKPVRHVVVTLRRTTRQPHPEMVAALTGDDGTFSLSGLPESGYEIRAQKAGYLGDAGQWLSLHPVAASISLTMRLTKGAVIAGTVRDERGVPVAGAQLGIASGMEQGPLDSSGTTDNNGAFRLAKLSRGTYRIGVLSPGSGTLLRAQGMTFSPVYYPAAGDSAAAPIDLIPGQEVNVDLRVTRIPAREIRGRVESSGTLIGVSALPAGNGNYLVTWGLARNEAGSREFRVSGLAPGVYVLSFQMAVSSSIDFLTKTVQIADADVTNVVVLSTDRPPRR